MADRFPLVVDSSNNNIKELPSGDNLDLTGSGLKVGGTVTVGVDDAGYDVKFFGDTASAYMLWDTSVDDLILGGAARAVIPDSGLVLGSTAVTSTAAELNLLNNVSGLVQADFTKLAAVNSTAAELNLISGAGTLKQAGKETIWVPATAMYPNTTGGCAALAQVELTNGPELKCLVFDGGGTEECAQFSVAFPKCWNEGTITFQVFWCSSASGTEGVSWGLQGVGIANDASLNSTFSQAGVVVDDTKTVANDLLVSPESTAVTIPNAAVDILTIFQIYRDTDDANDTDTSNDARLLGIKLFFTTDAANDA